MKSFEKSQNARAYPDYECKHVKLLYLLLLLSVRPTFLFLGSAMKIDLIDLINSLFPELSRLFQRS
jgi:hypothetical protein